MAKKQTDASGSYLIEQVFDDVHEYEVFFEFSNKESADKLSPNKLVFIFKLNGRRMEVIYPDDERTVEIVIPITKAQDNPQNKRKLTKRYINEFGDLIPKIRLSVKNQIAATNKVIGPTDKIRRDINQAVKKRRTEAARKAKALVKPGKK